ncbi:MAG: galactokinase [Sphingopyxis sp.]
MKTQPPALSSRAPSSSAQQRAIAAYHRQFGVAPTIITRAPGRVNLIGEHTDYNDGFVLPCAIDRDTVVAAGPVNAAGAVNTGGAAGTAPGITTLACDFADALDHFDPGTTIAHAQQPWADYVRGMATILRAHGVPVGPMQMAIAGDVPLGSGLSSSASLEIAVGSAMAAMAGTTPDPAQLAQWAQQAENQFVGCACGIMDQLISTCAVAGHALQIDCRTLARQPVAMPANAAIIIAHSGVRHAHAGGEYNDRRRQCEDAARHYGVPALRDLDLTTLVRGRGALDDLTYRRARHVVTENARVLAAADALAAGDLHAMGVLMAQSHASMRDDFEITVPAVDQLAAIMRAAVGRDGGARMTGGGFGGCVVAIAHQSAVDRVAASVAAGYRAPDGQPAELFVTLASGGAGFVNGPAADAAS